MPSWEGVAPHPARTQLQAIQARVPDSPESVFFLSFSNPPAFSPSFPHEITRTPSQGSNLNPPNLLRKKRFYATLSRLETNDLMMPFTARLFRLIAFCTWSTLSAGPLIPISIDRLTTESDLVVHADVVGKSVQRDEQGRIYTKIQLDVREYWKGPERTGPLTLVHSGGILGNQWSTADGEVSYKLGEEVVVFMILNSRGEGVTKGMVQGKFLIQPDATNSIKYARSRFHGGEPPTPNGPKGYRFPTQLPLTIDRLKSQVTRHKS